MEKRMERKRTRGGKRWTKLPIVLIFFFIICATGILTSSESAAEKKFFVLPTASPGGSYYPMGALLASLWNEKLKDKEIFVTSQASGGSYENCNMMSAREVIMGMSAVDIAMSAFKGEGRFKGRPYKDMRVMTVIFPTYQSWGVTYKSGIMTTKDMKGKRISVGKAGSASVRNAEEMLQAAGLSFKDLAKVEYLGWDQSAEAMKDGKLDGALFQGSPPTPALIDLYSSKAGMVIPLTDDEIKKICAPGIMYPAVIKPNTYPGQKEPIMTVGRANLFLADARADEHLIYDFTKVMFENLNYLKAAYHGFRTIDPQKPYEGVEMSKLYFHPGSIKYFQEKGVKFPGQLIPPK